MKYCSQCGTPAEDNTVFCTNCGAQFPAPAVPAAEYPTTQAEYVSTQAEYPTTQTVWEQPQPAPQEKVKAGLIVLSVFFPIVGVILFFAMKKKAPKTAKICGIVAAVLLLLQIAGGTAIALSLNKKADETTVEKGTINTNIYGSVTGNSYENKFFNIGYKIDYNYAFDSQEEMIKYGWRTKTYEDTGILYATWGDGIILFDSRFDDNEYTIFLTTEELTSVYSFPNKEKVLEYALQESDSWEVVSVDENYKTETIADRSFLSKKQTVKEKEGAKEQRTEYFFVTENDGQYFLISIYDYDTKDDETYKKLLDNFYSLS